MSPRCPLFLALLAGCAPSGDWTIKPGVEMVTVTGAEPDEPLTLYDGRTALLTVLADDMGQAHFAYVPESPITLDSGAGMVLPVENGAVVEPGRYRIRNDEAGTVSAPFEVLSIDDLPDPSLYESQRVEGVYTSLLGEAGADAADGFHYIEMRDGVLLSVLVRYPDPTLYGYGPYPTVVEYSGYSPSRPDRNSSGQQIANAMGFATVGVNMRGTGCSGGVFDVFNPAQHADGYDIIETVARQPWVLDGRVGMVGLSYPGISQLYVASTNPPSLAGVVPLSVIADAWEMQWPGGIYNSGFTRQWVGNRDSDASVGGSDWVTKRIEGGDTVCEENVRLSNQNIDFESFLRALEYRPIHADPRDLNLLVEKIEAPVFLGGAFQDEQTGALYAGMLDRFDASEGARFTIANGRHPDGYAPEMAYRWFEFLEFYVARRIPRLNAAVRLGAAPEFGSVYGMTDVAFEDDRFDDFGDDYAAALAAYEAEPRVRVLFEVGAEGSPTGAPESRFEATFETWPSPTAEEVAWYLDADGLLAEQPGAAGADVWSFDADAGSETFFGPSGYQIMAPLWDIDWTYFAEGEVVAYQTPAFSEDTVLAGPGIAELWLRSPEEDVTVQVTLTEVTPDGDEVLIQSGWLRLGHRAASEGSSLRLDRSYSVEDFEPVVPGEWTRAEVAIGSFAHPVRTGSSLRMAVSAPGRDHGLWEFEAPQFAAGPPDVELGRGGERASRLRIATLPGIDVPEGRPPCPSLRGQPCREAAVIANREAP